VASDVNSHPNPPRGHLLVVDDNRINRLLLGRALENLGHSVRFAETGRAALDLLREHRVDLVLLDIEMPDLNGFQVLEVLADDPHYRDLPVVVLSSVEEIDSVARCIELGAEDYLFKPVNTVLLTARINASLEKKRLRDQQRELFRKFATAEVAEELLTTGLSVSGKLVDATVLFCDIRSFTSIAESLSPEKTIELLNNYYALMFDAIGAHGGIISQMLGDGLMAIFGAPIPHSDHRMHAALTALEMVELVKSFNRDWPTGAGQEIRIGVGIASGTVIAGLAGTERRMTYTCVGDTVNVAAHLEGHTKTIGRSILMNENTRSGLGDEMQIEPVGPAKFKSRKQPVEVYSLRVKDD
jgi:adenylate cyclase